MGWEGRKLPKIQNEPFQGILALPAFPVVLVTVDRNIMTAAAFSFYSFEPPCVMVGIMPENLTFDLISERGEFGINIPAKEQIEAVRICGSRSGRDGDKFIEAGLTTQRGSVIDSCLIAECPVSLECKVVHRIQFMGSHAWFIGQIKAVQIEEGYARDQALMYWLQEYRAVGEVLPVKKQGQRGSGGRLVNQDQC
jgi:flavin reductase (DIM6/NTAB) family NADH-FMN oxidoreductase RutF